MKNQPNKTTVKDGWKLIGHSHQIADTGDYDGHYEITNGKISLLTQDDDDESLQPIVGALNDSGCKFYQDDWFEFENKILKEDAATLRERVKELEAQVFDLTEIINGINGCRKISLPWPDELEKRVNKIWEELK